jgi:uncharacterized metal-binding protein YceD (DUF177 family)
MRLVEMTEKMQPEFSLFIAASDVPPSGREVRFEADEATRQRLAERFDIVEITRLVGTAQVRPYRKDGLTLECRFEADLAQNCVVTLEPVSEHVSEEFRQRYLPEKAIERAAREVPGSEREIAIDIEAEDAPEPMEGGGIDVGEAVAERLALAMDPYPRKPEASFETQPEEEDDAPEEKPNPFAVLEKLKKNY